MDTDTGPGVDTDTGPGVDTGTGTDEPEQPSQPPPPGEDLPALCDAGDASLIACFRFEGSPDDDSANGFKPERSRDLSYVPGKDGQALKLGRRGDLRFRHDAAWAAAAMTIDVWINPASLPEDTRYAVIDSGGKPSIFLMPGGVVRCTMGVERNVSAGVVAGKWTHVACLSDGQTQILYVNGVEVDRSPSGPVLAEGEQPIHIGSDEPSGRNEFDGLIDSLRVFRRTLTPQEVCAAAGNDGC
ncbi:LamG domain-containing protein [Sorangium cellulosum]|uniref:LamG domain-containing protein n=1 Tax=Sorangium cellulosum TaxID=56 RepID=UPI001F2858FF|nr:LamG domain-containing protein [Sorangium cellulosum]